MSSGPSPFTTHFNVYARRANLNALLVEVWTLTLQGPDELSQQSDLDKKRKRRVSIRENVEKSLHIQVD
jgi:hypothetical protein